ncbi:MAG: hypothetical protein RIE58_03430 [Vicingaceae bacterium]
MSLPTIICTSVIRSSKQGESHGGMYLLNLENEKFELVVDWNDSSINWEGRGADRGLRGIAFYDDLILAAASDEIYFFDQKFKAVRSIKNKYLKHCHEIYIHENTLYLSSTGYDSILLYNLVKNCFVGAYCYRKSSAIKGKYWRKIRKMLGLKQEKEGPPRFYTYDPNSGSGPFFQDTFHINNVFIHQNSIYFSGTLMDRLMKITKADELEEVCALPMGTHNVRFDGYTLTYNDTASDRVVQELSTGGEKREFNISHYNSDELDFHNIPKDHARQGFGRGMVLEGNLLIGGSSPSTISVYDLIKKERIKKINLTMDVRNSIHGLEIYPYQNNF